MLADWVALVIKPQLAFALQDQEHFLFAMMAVERALSLPGRQDCQVLAELLGSDVIANLATEGGVKAILFYVVKLHLIEVHNGLHHVVLQ